MRVPVTEAEAVTTARRRLASATVWRDDRLATLAWWSDADLLAALGPGLAAMATTIGPPPTVVAGVQSSGYLLAPLVAVELGVGMLGIQKLTGPDHITLATDVDALSPHDRVLLVDDVLETAAQARAVRDLVRSRGAALSGVAVLVAYRRVPDLDVTALWGVDELYRHAHPPA